MRTVVEGTYFAEGPRWHDGALWFSDIHGGEVHRVVDGRDEVVLALDERPSGLGWLPDGRLLVVCMRTDRVVRVEPDGRVALHADLAGIVRGTPNDMITTADGTAFVGDMGARIFDEHPDHSVPGQVLRVHPDGRVAVAHDPMLAPNGMAVDPDGRRLLVAESAGMRLTAFDLGPGGELSGMRAFAALRPESAEVVAAAPDGICLDAEGAVWVADPLGRRVLRVLDGGEVAEQHTLDGLVPVACVLGGPDRRTLFVCAAEHWRLPEVLRARTGRVLALDVAVPGAGRP